MNNELPFIKDMFNSIAPRYDLLNRLLSLRQDVVWRKKLVKAINIIGKKKVLDVACGTGDVLLEMIKQSDKETLIAGIDFSSGMLDLAKKKLAIHQKNNFLQLVVADAFNLPFKQNSFEAITIAFGIRNIKNRLKVLKAFHDCLTKDGILAILELTTPRSKLFLNIYLLYFQKILPLIGKFFAGHQQAYQYLPESVINFPDSTEFREILISAGFKKIKIKRLTLGIATLYTGFKQE